MRILKIMADYECFPLWEDCDGGVNNVNPRDLPLSHNLIDDILKWSEEYDRNLNHDYPPDSGFKNKNEEDSFIICGSNIRKKMQDELGDEYTINYIELNHK